MGVITATWLCCHGCHFITVWWNCLIVGDLLQKWLFLMFIILVSLYFVKGKCYEHSLIIYWTALVDMFKLKLCIKWFSNILLVLCLSCYLSIYIIFIKLLSACCKLSNKNVLLCLTDLLRKHTLTMCGEFKSISTRIVVNRVDTRYHE